MVYPLLKNKVAETQGLIAIMAQWGLTAEELLPTIDKINLTADNWAVSSEDLVNGLNRSSGAARVLGLTLEETISILTVMREATGRTGKEVGNALNSILSFMQRPSAIKAFETQGIRVFADEARTQFRNVIEIFDEMAAKWPQMSQATQDMFIAEAEAAGLYSEEMAELAGVHEQWTDIQQRDLSQAAAGIYRRNYLLALLKNWAKVDEVLIGMEDALGYSMRENERTMATLAKQWEALKAAAERFAVAIGDAGLLEELKRVVVFSKDVVEAFNNMDDSLQTLLITFAEITLAIKLFAAVGKMAGISGGLSAAGGILAGWSVPITAATSRVQTLTQAVTALTTVLRNVGAATVAAFGGPAMLAVTLATTAIVTFVRQVRAAETAIIENGELAGKLVGQYDKLSNRLQALNKDTDEYTKAAQELRDVNSQIAKSLPQLIDGWDEETDSIKINREKMQEMIDASKELKDSKKDLSKELETSIQLMEQEVAAHQQQLQYWETEEGVLNDLVQRRNGLLDALANTTEGSEKAIEIQQALGETEMLIADIAEEAGLKRNATVDEVVKKINDLKVTEQNAVINTQQSEKQRLVAVKEGALARIKIIEQEMAAYGDPSKWGFFEATGNFVKTMFGKPLPKALEREKAEKALIAEEATKQVAAIEKSMRDAERAINAISADSFTGGGTSGVGSAGGFGTGKSIDAIAEALERLADSAKMFELVNMDLDSALAAVNQQLSMADAEFEYLNQRMEYGAATAQDYARMQELVAFKLIMLEDEQRNLATANEVYQKQMEALKPLLAKATAEYERFKAAGDAEHTEDAASAVASLKREMDGLSSSIADNTAQLWQNKSTMEQLTQSTYTQYYQSMMNWMNHMEAIGRMTTQQQLDILRELDGDKSQQDEWQRQEKMYQRRRDLLNEEMDRIKDAYNDRMKMYEEEVEANERLIESKEKQSEVAVSAIDEQIKAIQRLMDLLDDEGETEDREESERQHNQKIADLIEERQYHELRTGREHLERIDEINREISEENRRWQLQQNDWAREDQKDAYQDQIDALREKQKAIEKSAREEINRLKDTNNRKKQEMQKYYNELQGILNDHNLNMLATVGGYNDQMFQKGLELMRSLADGMRAGRDMYSLDEVDDFFGKTQKERDRLDPNEGRPSDNTGSGSYQYTKDSYQYTKEQAHAKAESARAQLRALGYSQGVADISSYDTYEGTLDWYNKYIRNRTDLKQNVKDLFWEIVEARRIWTQLDKAHTGAYVAQSGVAELLKGERVLSPQMTLSFDRLSAVLGKMPDIPERIAVGGGLSGANLDRVADRIIAAIERRGNPQIGTLLNIEHAGFEDRADMQALGVEVRSILATAGR
jgi:hypothetical protein